MMYGFKARFREPILAGTKTGTIRAPRAGRSRHARPGDALQLKSGPRFRPVVFADTTCTELLAIHLLYMGSSQPQVIFGLPGSDEGTTCHHDRAKLDPFAVSDGFVDWEDLCRFWWDTHKTRSFSGSWIRWLGAEVVAR